MARVRVCKQSIGYFESLNGINFYKFIKFGTHFCDKNGCMVLTVPSVCNYIFVINILRIALRIGLSYI